MCSRSMRLIHRSVRMEFLGPIAAGISIPRPCFVLTASSLESLGQPLAAAYFPRFSIFRWIALWLAYMAFTSSCFLRIATGQVDLT